MAKKFRPRARDAALELIELSSEVANLTKIFDPPKDWDSSCAEFEKDGAIELSERARQYLWDVIQLFVMDAYCEPKRKSAAETRSQIDQMAHHANKLSGLLNEAKSANPSSVWSFLSYNSDDRGDLHYLLNILEKFDRACNAALTNFNDHVVETKYRSRPGFEQFISRISTIYHFAEGQVSTSFSPNAPVGQRRWTPFIRFSLAVYKHAQRMVPTTLDVIEDATFGDAVDSINRRLKKDADIVGDDKFLQIIARGLSDS